MILGLLISLAATSPLRAEEFNIAVGDTVSDGVPAAGAGRLAIAKEVDSYSFTAAAGQLAFFESLGQDPAFKGNLRWQLLKPSGSAVFSSFFSYTPGRTVLPEAGSYNIRVYSDATDPLWIGPYSFRVLPIPPDQTFPFTLGSQVSDGVPAPGAGRIEVAGAEDNYLFTATAGDLAFFESLAQDPAFKGNLRWQLVKPSGGSVFSSFFSNPQGRTVLPEAGQYRIRIFTDGNQSGWFGTYSFRAQFIPADQTFAYAIGTAVSDGVPAPGAGKLEAAGTEDNYFFTATAGQIVFFESTSQDAAFNGNLRWQLVKPSGGSVFSSFFSNPQGRTVLPEAGQYRIRIFTDGNQSGWFGTYSFRAQFIPADQTFAYAIGTAVSDGVPAPGAGKLEAAGTEDNYFFTATAGQIVFFESTSQDAAFNGNLRWQLVKPSGGSVFSSFFSNPQGRTVLPEAGQYRIRIFTDGTTPGWFGSYSFNTRGDLADQQFPIRVGDVISDGKPASGAGRIETPGSEDTYTFDARAGQFVVFESLEQDAAFQKNLRWELTKPSGGSVFSSFFSNPQGRTLLPEAGTYKIRVFTGADTTSWIGAYSFRTYSPVRAFWDSIATQPGQQIVIPSAKLLFNDEADDATDVLSLALPNAATTEGGTITLAADGVRYSPKAGFTGTDHFTYLLQGALGGTDQTTVAVAVTPDAGNYATVVNWVRQGTGGAVISLLGDASKDYLLESSQDLTDWLEVRTLTFDLAGFATFPLEPTPDFNHLFFRARRKP
jgi:Cadherin-like domain